MGADNDTTDQNDETSTGSDTTNTDDKSTSNGGNTSSDIDRLKAALEKEREARREADKTAKSHAAELEKFRKSTMSDAEKAITEARAAARAEVLAEVGSELVEAALRNALDGRGSDADALLEGVDPKRFLTEDGKPDTKRIAAWVDKVAPKGAGQKNTDMGQGARGGGGPAQITDRAALKSMTPHEIEKARQEGRLDQLMRG